MLWSLMIPLAWFLPSQRTIPHLIFGLPSTYFLTDLLQYTMFPSMNIAQSLRICLSLLKLNWRRELAAREIHTSYIWSSYQPLEEECAPPASSPPALDSEENFPPVPSGPSSQPASPNLPKVTFANQSPLP